MEREFCEGLPFWSTLSAAEQKRFCENLTHLTYQKGEKVHSGENCKGVIFLQTGCLRVYMLSEEGRDITLYRLYQGDVCMLSASCVLPEITFDVFVDAEEDCNCLVIRGSVFSEIAQENLLLKLFAYETVLTRFSEVIWVIQQIHFMKVDRRLAVFLWDERQRTNSDVIALTQEQIAKYMSSAREVVARMLKRFASEGMLEYRRGAVLLKDMDALAETAGVGRNI